MVFHVILQNSLASWEVVFWNVQLSQASNEEPLPTLFVNEYLNCLPLIYYLRRPIKNWSEIVPLCKFYPGNACSGTFCTLSSRISLVGSKRNLQLERQKQCLAAFEVCNLLYNSKNTLTMGISILDLVNDELYRTSVFCFS